MPDSINTAPTMAHLRELPFWCTWRSEVVPGRKKPTKVPRHALRDAPGSSTDIGSRGTYEQASTTAAMLSINIGLVLAGWDRWSLCGIDIDDCFGLEGDLAEWAKPIVEMFAGCYMEVSPSGHGLHILFWMRDISQAMQWDSEYKRPHPEGHDSGHDGYGFELYARGHGRYFATGKPWNNGDLRVMPIETLVEAQRYMTEFAGKPTFKPKVKRSTEHDPERALRLLACIPNDASFTSRDDWLHVGMALHDACHDEDSLTWDRLAKREWTEWTASAGHGDAEAACSTAWKSFEVGGGFTIATLVEHAKRYGFDRNGRKHEPPPPNSEEDYGAGERRGPPPPRGEADYGTTKGKGKGHDSDDQKLFDFIDAGSFEGKPLPVVEDIIEGLITIGVAYILVGDSGTGKSLLAQFICTCIALGLPIFGRPTKQMVTAYVTAEDTLNRLHIRQDRINRALNITWRDLAGKLKLYSEVERDIWLWSEGQPTALSPLIESKLQSFNARFVMIDNASRTFDDEEIVRRRATGFMQHLNRLGRRLDGTIVLIAHPSRSSGDDARSMASGSTGWVSAARGALLLRYVMQTVEDEESGKSKKMPTEERELILVQSNEHKQGQSFKLVWSDEFRCLLPEQLETERMTEEQQETLYGGVDEVLQEDAEKELKLLLLIKEHWYGPGQALTLDQRSNYRHRYLPELARRKHGGKASDWLKLARDLLMRGQVVYTDKLRQKGLRAVDGAR